MNCDIKFKIDLIYNFFQLSNNDLVMPQTCEVLNSLKKHAMQFYPTNVIFVCELKDHLINDYF